MKNKDKSYQQDTNAIRGGYQPTHEKEHSEALFLTSSYVFDNAEMAAQSFSNEIEGNVYSRYTNPTVRSFEQRLAMLEDCLLYTSPSPRDKRQSRMPSSA